MDGLVSSAVFHQVSDCDKPQRFRLLTKLQTMMYCLTDQYRSSPLCRPGILKGGRPAHFRTVYPSGMNLQGSRPPVTTGFKHGQDTRTADKAGASISQPHTGFGQRSSMARAHHCEKSMPPCRSFCVAGLILDSSAWIAAHRAVSESCYMTLLAPVFAHE